VNFFSVLSAYIKKVLGLPTPQFIC